MIEREAIRAVAAHKVAAIFFALALAGIAGISASLLWVPDSTALALTASAVGWIAVASGVLVWAGATVIYYRAIHEGAQPHVLGSISTAARRLPPLWVWLVLTAGLMWLAWRWNLTAWALLIAVPWMGAAAARGFHGYARPHALRALPVLAILAAAVWGTVRIWEFHPQLGGLSLETASLAVRVMLAFTVGLLAWLTCASTMGRLHAERP